MSSNRTANILIVSAAVAILTVAIGSTAGADTKSPFDALKDQVATLFSRTDSLQQQVNNIQLTPGPQGPQGNVGPQGPQGTPGTGVDKSKQYKTFSTITVPPHTTYSTTAYCRDANDVLLNGGFTVSSGVAISSSDSNPGSATTASGWGIAASNNTDTPGFEVATATCLAVD